MPVICIFLLFHSCKREKAVVDPGGEFSHLDTYLRTRPFNPDSLQHYISAIEEELLHSERKQMGYGKKHTTVHYKWNADSSMTLIRAYKTFSKGFSREVILHSGDTLLLVHRFSTEPLSLGSDDHTFLESVYYLERPGTIRHLSRIEYDMKDLRDTIPFQQKAFTDLTDNISRYYSVELNYSTNIFSIN
jgi:hypothetical protein